jgi:hypothetical protein
MELMNTREAAKQLGVNELVKSFVLQDASQFVSKTYYLPVATADRTILAKSIGRVVAAQGSCWLQITYWNNDVDSNQDLFYAYRRGYGDQRSLAEASVYKFSPEDAHCVSSVLSLVIYFGWDARIFNLELTYQVRVNNDGFLDLESTGASGRAIEEELTMLGLSQMVAA